MRLINNISLAALLSAMLTVSTCFAEEPLSDKTNSTSGHRPYLFKGKVNADNINLRADSTPGSAIICKMNKGEDVEVLLELYEWYNVRLPRKAPSFIKKDFVTTIADNQTVVDAARSGVGKVTSGNVNIRLRPDTSSAILGSVKTGESVNITEDLAGWYKIEPISDSFGWIHKNFVYRVKEKDVQPPKESKEDTAGEIKDLNLIVEGLIKPKIFKWVATHKLITQDKKLYLLSGKKEDLDNLNHRRVKITGKLVNSDRDNNQIIKIEKIEALD